MESLQSHYCINVAHKTGEYRTGGGQTVDTAKHFFSVNVIGQQNAMDVFASLRKAYSKELYCIDVTYWDIGGKSMDWETESKPKG
jgi:hypothetical protein